MLDTSRARDQVFKSNNVKEKEKIFQDKKTYIFAKRSIDIIGALVMSLLILPAVLFILMLYLFESKKGPVLFKQERAGKHGEMFNIYKFRSMAIDAEDRLKREPSLYQKYVDNNYKLEPHEDPRITKLGAFLRKTSLDELPQIINVLKGEMSLVGPRPVVKPELEEYGDHLDKFLSVKPGVTGYWQVSGRSDVVYPERVNVELYYVYNRSLKLDIKILFKTVSQVLLRKGAY
ncbi:sugar transferase [Shouchella lehensis]|uniref:Sugar transferase n=1 Tax=Shouchella lehensis TaxID=300825 RepID=A0A4Y7WFC0_9BACI|nr:multidrug MFS transporter [Shouchella lehensis]TES46448.1 sugar transferase [Shouchella lehensis]